MTACQWQEVCVRITNNALRDETLAVLLSWSFMRAVNFLCNKFPRRLFLPGYVSVSFTLGGSCAHSSPKPRLCHLRTPTNRPRHSSYCRRCLDAAASWHPEKSVRVKGSSRLMEAPTFCSPVSGCMFASLSLILRSLSVCSRLLKMLPLCEEQQTLRSGQKVSRLFASQSTADQL